MISQIRLLLPLLLLILVCRAFSFGDTPTPKRVLIIVEGTSDLKNHAMGDGRQLATLMGHFNTTVRVEGVDEYVSHSMNGFDYVFYIGFRAKERPPSRFLEDVLTTDLPVIWLNTGFREFSAARNVRRRFGFFVSRLDTASVFDIVKSRGQTFTKGEPNLNIIEITNRSQVTVLATALSSRTKREVPYIVRSGNLMYVGDSPFASATESDRYLLFSDMLHDILHEEHEEAHSAIIRIEDVTPLENPDHLRDIADILSSRGIPFLVAVIPFYVDPGEGIHVSLSEKPDLVDALHYMVQNGGTIVMHGVTHQYKGVTASDFEFWDEVTNSPVKNLTQTDIARKLDMGIQEFMKNGLYPLAWETPHYAAPFVVYRTVATYFSTAIEQRLSIEDFDYGQYFPYIIKKDLFGQTIYPENLGYIPLDPDKVRSEEYVRDKISYAKTNLAVRDGFASCFFHAFVDLELLKELVDGIQSLGYTYIDLREQPNWVNTRDRVILSGSQSYTIHLDGQYLAEAYFEKDGEVFNRIFSDGRLTGSVTRSISLSPGQFYKAEPAEYRERKPTFAENIIANIGRFYRSIVSSEETWREARIAILWNYHARGAAYNDQASFASVFGSVNLKVDTIFVGQRINPAPYNLLIAPYAFIDSLQPSDYDVLTHFVDEGGNLITDSRNDLAEELGVKFSGSRVNILRVRDLLFPQEPITWRYPELMDKFDVDHVDENFCVSEETQAPLAVGLHFGRGRVIYFGTRFDPNSQHGYSLYPYLLEYVRRYFKLGPVVRRDNLEVYFEPGSRPHTSVEQLVRRWVEQGIRTIHVSGWHQYPKYTYDYKRLIDLAHANGILVYAWLEPPQVSQKFWIDHPEWREKNYKGEDWAGGEWRVPMAMTDDSCVAAMTEQFRDLLEQFDWDGVNLAELYFVSVKGFKDPKSFTPMHPSAQREVKKLYGFDLVKIFDPTAPEFWKINPEIKRDVEEYRINKLTQVYQKLLTCFAAIARERPGFQIIVTAMDSYGNPELRETNGVDMTRIVALQRKFGFLLQVEDPESRWSTPPSRYIAMGKEYAGILGDSTKLLLDLNIGSFRKPEVITPFPTLVQTGTESFHLVNDASRGAPRMTIYSESSINPQDLRFFPYALATGVSYRQTGDGYLVHALTSFDLKLPRETQEITVDGIPLLPVRENQYLIPAGTHAISIGPNTPSSFSMRSLEGRILSITGNLLSVSYGMRRISFEYESRSRTLVSMIPEPTAVLLDGQEYTAPPAKGNDCFTLGLPPGRHRVEVAAGGTFSYGINVTSFWSTTAIAVFGSVAVMLLVIMYIVVRVNRFRIPQA